MLDFFLAVEKEGWVVIFQKGWDHILIDWLLNTISLLF